MTTYRLQIVHASYWRGAAHRWQNISHYSGAVSAADALGCLDDAILKMRNLCYKNYAGGVAEARLYDATAGGVPIASRLVFDWKVPTAWVPYLGSWNSATDTGPTGGEVAARFRTQAGVSRTGKPVFLSWYIHAISNGSPGTSSPDIAGALATQVNSAYNAFQTLSSAGTPKLTICAPDGRPVASVGAAQPYFVAHQRLRGRRISKATALAAAHRYGYSTVSDDQPTTVRPVQLN